MSQDRIEILLNKVRAVLLEDKSISRLERDLARKYLVEVYDLIDELTTDEGDQEHNEHIPSKPAIGNQPPTKQSEKRIDRWAFSTKSPDEEKTPRPTAIERSNGPEIEQKERSGEVNAILPESESSQPPSNTSEREKPEIRERTHYTREPAPSNPLDRPEPSFNDLREVVTKRHPIPSRYQILFDKEGDFNELSDRLSKSPIHDLSKALGINDKHLVVNELFNNQIEDFQETIDVLNAKYSFDDAKTYLVRHVIDKYKWLDEEKLDRAREFIKLIERRFIEV